MRKFIKSVVAAVLVASMSVTGLATMASAKTTSSSVDYNRDFISYDYLPKPNSFYGRDNFTGKITEFNFTENDADNLFKGRFGSGGREIMPIWFENNQVGESIYARSMDRSFPVETLAKNGADCFKGVNDFSAGYYPAKKDMTPYTGYTPANVAWNMAIALDMCARQQYYGLRGESIIDFLTRYTFADLFWYLKQYCGYTDSQIAKFKSEAKLYIKTVLNPLMDGNGARPYTDAEIEKYWDKLVWAFDYDDPTFTHSNASQSVWAKTPVNVLDMKDDEVFWDYFGHALTKSDVLAGNLPTGYSGDLKNVWATSAAKKIMGDTYEDWVIGKTAKECYKETFKVVATDSIKTSDAKTSAPTLTKSAKIAKTQLNKVMKGLKDGSVKMTTAEYKALKKIYQNADMPSSVISGKTFNKNLKIALVQKLRYALPYMSNAQVKSLRVQLAGILV